MRGSDFRALVSVMAILFFMLFGCLPLAAQCKYPLTSFPFSSWQKRKTPLYLTDERSMLQYKRSSWATRYEWGDNKCQCYRSHLSIIRWEQGDTDILHPATDLRAPAPLLLLRAAWEVLLHDGKMQGKLPHLQPQVCVVSTASHGRRPGIACSGRARAVASGWPASQNKQWRGVKLFCVYGLI